MASYTHTLTAANSSYAYTRVRLVLIETVDEANNSSKFTWRFEGYVTDTATPYSCGFSFTSASCPVTITIDGKTYTVWNSDKRSFRLNWNGSTGSSEKPIIYKSGTADPVVHNEDGTKKISIAIKATFNGVVYSSSKTIDLATITRASSVTLSKSSYDFGESVVFTIDRSTSTYKHKIEWIGGTNASYTQIADNIDTSYTWMIPTELITQYPNASSGTITFKITTFDGTKEVGTIEKSITANVPPDILPVINSVAINDAGSFFTNMQYIEKNDGTRIYIWKTTESVSTTAATVSFTKNLLTNEKATTISENDRIVYNGYYYTINSITSTAVNATKQSPCNAYSTYGVMIQKYSIPSIEVNASGALGSTIKSYEYRIGNNLYTGIANNILTEPNVYQNYGDVEYSVTVIDSRNRSVSRTGTFHVSQYTEPYIQAIEVSRTDSYLVPDDNGDYVTLRVVGTGSYFVDAEYQNACQWSYRYREFGTTEWSEPMLLADTVGVNATINRIPMSSDASWEINVLVSDSISGEVVFEAPPISSAQVPMDLLHNGKGMGIGTIATKSDTLQIGWNVEAMKDISSGSPIVTEPRSVSANNANGGIQIKVDIDGTIGLYDNKNSKWILKSTETGYELSPDFATNTTEVTKFHNYTDGPGYVYVSSDGVAEVGEYLDFHIKSLDTSSTDHDIRMQAKYSRTNGKYLAVDTQIEATNLQLSSDRRLKSDITAISDVEALKILEFIPSTYRFNGQNRYSKGLIAQEVEEILPELVHTDDNGYKSLDYISIIPLLIKMVQIQQKEIDELKEKVK